MNWLSKALKSLYPWASVRHKLNEIIMNQAELKVALDNLTAQEGKIATEQATRFDTLTAKIAELEAIIKNGSDVTPEVTTALANLQAAAQALDDVIPDAP